MTRLVRAALAALVPGCAVRARAPEPAPITFAIEVANAAGPVYVMLGGSDDQPGWVSVTGPAGRVYLRERCEIEDCGAPPAVCGAALPVIRNIGAGAAVRRVELTWDGMTSELDVDARCERRRPAPPGAYVARFCHAREADLEGTAPVQSGRLVRPTCVDRPFTLRERRVTLTI